MPAEADIGIEIAREASESAMEEFKANLAFFQKNPNPDPRARPAGGVPLPGMGRRPGPPRPPRPSPGVARPSPGGAGGGSGGNGAPSARQFADWQKKADQIALQTMLEARRDFIPDLLVTGMTTDRANVRAKAQAQKGSIRQRIVTTVKAELKRSASRA